MGARICLIFNPAARGEKARRFQRQLETIGADGVVQPTCGPGAARALAQSAVAAGFDTLVAAGGDGTVNEVINGIDDAPGGLDRVRLAVMPLGTVNVFAKELGMPASTADAWRCILAGKERRIDLPQAQFCAGGQPCRRCFVQLAGAGLDARAIELVDWTWKKRVGALAYVWAVLRAMREPPRGVSVEVDAMGNEPCGLGDGRNLRDAEADTHAPDMAPKRAADGATTHACAGSLVLIGNGRFYGGRYAAFPRASVADGRLDICCFCEVRLRTIARTMAALALSRVEKMAGVRVLQAARFTLRAAAMPVSLELDGERVGELPATFSVRPRALRVVVP